MKRLIFILASFAALLVLAGLPALAAGEAPTITQQPQNISVQCNSEVSFTVAAKGNHLAYQWYYQKYGEKTWLVYTGMNDPTLYVFAKAEMDGWRFRCQVSGDGGKVVSSAANLTVSPEIVYWSYIWKKNTGEEKRFSTYEDAETLQQDGPRISGEVGDTVVYSVVAQGHDLTYQWYYSYDLALSKWIPMNGETGKQLTITLTDGFESRYLNCVVTASNGMTCEWHVPLGTVRSKPYIRLESNSPENQREIAETYDLYFIPDAYQGMIQMPDKYSQSIDLGEHKLQIISGKSVLVSNGKITTNPRKTYSYELPSGFWVSSDEPTGRAGEVVTSTYESGDTVIRVDGNYYILVRVHNYTSVYAEGIMDAYLAKNIRKDMTDYEKAEKCCQFVAGYDYSTERSGYTGMILTGGGDCWASTLTLQYMLEKIGLPYKINSTGSRNSAGDNHLNVVAKLDGLYYILEAGYVAEAPRPYSMEVYGSPFAYSKFTRDSQTEIKITGYLNVDLNEDIIIPAYIEGYPVTRIGDNAFKSESKITRIVLPETIREIEKEAFYQLFFLREINLPSGLKEIGSLAFAYCQSLETVTIPAQVESVTSSVFYNCKELKSIHVDPKNTHYKSINGVLYNADGTELIACPTGFEGALTVPEGVNTIDSYAFGLVGNYGRKLTSLSLPDSLREIQPYAFYFTTMDLLALPEGIIGIPSSAFESHSIDVILLPESLQRIEDYAFYRGDACSVSLPSGVTYIGKMAFAGDKYLTHIHLPASVKEIGDQAFDLTYGWAVMGGGQNPLESYITFDKGCNPAFGNNVFSNAVLGVAEGSAAHQYAEANDIPFLLTDSKGKAKIDASWFTEPAESSSFYGTPVTPSVTVNTKAAPLKLIQDSDYRVEYENNDRVGTATAIVRGIGRFSGSVSFTFEIENGSMYITFNANGGSLNLFHGKTTYYGVKLGKTPEALHPMTDDLPGDPVYEFVGWFTERSGGEQITEDTVLTFRSNQTLFAHWIIRKDLTGDGKVNVDDYVFDRLGRKPSSVIRLPKRTATLEKEAFAGVSAEVIFLPGSLTIIPEDALPKDLLLAVIENEELIPWLKLMGIPYLINTY